MKSNQTHPVKTRAHNNGVAQSSDVESVRGENKTLRRLVKRITKKAKQADEENAKLERSIAEMRSKTRREVARLNSACIGYRKRIADLLSSSSSSTRPISPPAAATDVRPAPSTTISPRVPSLHAVAASVQTGNASSNDSVDNTPRTLDKVLNKGIRDWLDFEDTLVYRCLDPEQLERRNREMLGIKTRFRTFLQEDQ